METLKETKEFSVLLLTPYLSENLTGMPDIEEQTERYKYNPDNFNGLEFVITEKGSRVILQNPLYESIHKRVCLNTPLPECIELPTLAIAGSTEPGEKEVRCLKGTGLVVARYSIFYGGNSSYTGSSPEEAGYALDIPKDVSAVKSLITSESAMSALRERSLTDLRDSLRDINQTLNKPILETPYLEQILS